MDDYKTGPIDTPENIALLLNSLHEISDYYRKSVEPWLNTAETTHVDRNPDRSLAGIKKGDALQRFMDDVPNLVQCMSFALQSGGDAQDIYRALLREGLPQMNGFPEEHFRAAHKMIESHTDESVRNAASKELTIYEMKLRNAVSQLVSRFQAPDARVITNVIPEGKTVPKYTGQAQG